MSQPNNRPEKRRLNPRKLLLSKWTAAQPQNRERHFLVTELIRDEQDNILGVELQAVSHATQPATRLAPVAGQRTLAARLALTLP